MERKNAQRCFENDVKGLSLMKVLEVRIKRKFGFCLYHCRK